MGKLIAMIWIGTLALGTAIGCGVLIIQAWPFAALLAFLVFFGVMTGWAIDTVIEP